MCIKSSFFKLIFLSFVLSIVVGCAGTAPRPVTTQDNISSITLEEDYLFRADYFTGVVYEYTLSSGVYEAVGLDSKGVYYQGKSDCLTTKVIETSWVLVESAKGKVVSISGCGIYLPSKANKFAKVFSVIGTEKAIREGEIGKAVSPKASTTSFSSQANTIEGGVGVGIGVGIVNAVIEAEKGRYLFVRNQQLSDKLRKKLVF